MKVKILALAVVLAAPLGFGQGTITDGNAAFVRTASSFDNTPDANFTGVSATLGTDHLFEAGWWFRLSGGTAETFLGAPTTQSYVGNGSSLTWASLGAGAFSAVETSTVKDVDGLGGPTPSGYVTQTLTVTNLSASTPLTVDLFHMVDVDLNGSTNDSGALLFRNNHIRITDGANVSEYRGVGGKAFLVRPFGATSVRSVLNDAAVTDFDNSGVPFGPGDISLGNQWTLTIPASGSASVTAVLSVNSSLVRGDFNDDSKNDLLLRNTTFDKHVVWQMDGMTRTAGVFVTPDVSNTNKHAGCTEDFSGDSKTDILFHDITTGDVEFWAMGGADGTVQQSVLPLAGTSVLTTDWVVAACGDVNRDGKADVLWRNTVTQKLKVWLMNDNTWTADLIPTPDQAVNGNWAVTALLDYDADGNLDFLWYNSTSGNAVQWFMDPAFVRTQGLFTSPTNAGNNNWKIVASGDYGRGKTNVLPIGAGDILFRNDTSGRIVGWIMDGVIAGPPTGNTRLEGLFACPTAVGATCDPSDPTPAPGALSWFIVGPR